MDDNEDLDDLLGEPELAPKRPRGGSGSGLSFEERATIVSRRYITDGLKNGKVPFKAELSDDIGYEKSNALGTLLGNGVRGKGMNLWPHYGGKDKGELQFCKENMQICWRHLDADAKAALLEELDMSAAEFADAVGKLPTAKRNPLIGGV